MKKSTLLLCLLAMTLVACNPDPQPEPTPNNDGQNSDSTETVVKKYLVKEYYTDPETAALAQEAHDNPDLKILFDASRKLSPQDLKTVTALVKSLAGDNDE